MDNRTIPEMVALASRAKTKVKQGGARAIIDLSFIEIKALAFVTDCILEDYSGPLTHGAPEILTHPATPEET